jgi:hypothetical protein
VSVRFIEGKYDGQEGATALVDSVSGFAFGPIFTEGESAQDFIEWLPLDARTYKDGDLETMYMRWRETLGEST